MSVFLFFLKDSLSLKFNSRTPLSVDLPSLGCKSLSLSNQIWLHLGLREFFLNHVCKDLFLLTPPLGVQTCVPRPSLSDSSACCCFLSNVLKLSPATSFWVLPHCYPLCPPPYAGSSVASSCPHSISIFSSFVSPPFLRSSSSHFNSPCFLPVSDRGHFCFVIFPS